MRLSLDRRLTLSRSSQALVAPRPLCSVYPSCASQYTTHRRYHKSTIRQGWRAPSLAKSISPQGSFDEGPEPAACAEAEPFWSGQNGLGASPRRTLMVTFTCDKCGAQRVIVLCLTEVSQSLSIVLGQSRNSLSLLTGTRTERTVNPVAWQQGLVLAQCGGCQAWHKLADAGSLIEEIRYEDADD